MTRDDVSDIVENLGFILSGNKLKDNLKLNKTTFAYRGKALLFLTLYGEYLQCLTYNSNFILLYSECSEKIICEKLIKLDKKSLTTKCKELLIDIRKSKIKQILKDG